MTLFQTLIPYIMTFTFVKSVTSVVVGNEDNLQWT
jgi:hypothetical protein